MNASLTSKLRITFNLTLAFVAFGGVRLRSPNEPARRFTNIAARQAAWEIRRSSGGQGTDAVAAGMRKKPPVSAQTGIPDWAGDLLGIQP
jgi:hypothetical protein